MNLIHLCNGESFKNADDNKTYVLALINNDCEVMTMLDKKNYMMLIEVCMEIDGLDAALEDLFGAGINDTEYCGIYMIYNLIKNLSRFAGDDDNGMDSIIDIMGNENTSIEQKYELLTEGMKK